MSLPPSFLDRRLRLVAVVLVAVALMPGSWGVLDGLRPVPRGLNDSGAEFAGPLRSKGPLHLSSPATLNWIASRGFHVVRLPFRWEQLQPELDGPLMPAAVASLKDYCREAHARGLGVIIDPHNYARYTLPDGRVGVIGTPLVPIAAFADFWRRMSRALHGRPGVWAYDLMNEPHNMSTRVWKRASQEALTAIRAQGDPTLILVPGNNWESAGEWVDCQGWDAWIHDPMDNFEYEAHCYFESSGTYAGSSSRLRSKPARKRLQHFIDWCYENGVRGFIGEFGCPRGHRWLGRLNRFMEVMDRARLGGTAWATGEAWPSSYPLLLRPAPGGQEPPQVAVLRRHLGGWSPSQMGQDFLRGYRVLYWRARYLARHLRDAVRRAEH